MKRFNEGRVPRLDVLQRGSMLTLEGREAALHLTLRLNLLGQIPRSLLRLLQW
jgi:hypothetical protein